MNATADTYWTALHSCWHVAKSFAPWNCCVIATNATIHTTSATAKSPIAATPSRPRIQATARAPHVSAKSVTITTWTTHVDIASDCRLAKRVVLDPGMHSANAVDHLRDAEVDDEARERE